MLIVQDMEVYQHSRSPFVPSSGYYSNPRGN